MAHTAYQTTFAGAGNQGSQIGHNSGNVENHFHCSTERVETPSAPSLLIPFQRDEDFVERSELLGQIHQQCSVPGSRTALVGFGGVGKSQLAIEYAYRVRDQSLETWVFWVHASNAARLEQSFRDIADETKIFGRRDPKADIFKLVHDWLRDPRRKWMLILDNVDDAGFLRDAGPRQTDRPLREYLPRSPNGAILVTSRSREAALALVERRIIEIGPMCPTDAQTLLEKKLIDHDGKDIVELATALEYMPLAIVQAAAYIIQRAPRCSVRNYIAEFQRNERNRGSLLDFEGGELRRDYEAKNSIIITWQISFRHIQQIRPSAADLLSLMSFCDRQRIPEALLRSPDRDVERQAKDKRGRDSDTDEEDGQSQFSVTNSFEYSIQTLRDFSFITVLDRTTFEIHSLVQLATRKWLAANGELENWKEQYLQHLGAVLPTGAFEHWEQCRTLFPHAKAAMAQRPKEPEYLIEWASILYKAAWYAHEQGNNADAIEMVEQAARVRKKILGPEDEKTLSSIEMVGSIYRAQGRWKRAEELQMQVIEIRRRVLGAEHPDTLTSIGNLALTYGDQGRWGEAEELEVQAIEIQKTVLGAEHPDTLTSMNNLALIYGDQGRWGEAEELEVQTMETLKRVLGAEHPDTLTSIGNLASTFWKQGRWKEAEELEVQAIETRKTVLGAEHPDTLISMANLASIYTEQGRWKEAEELEMQVIEIRKRVLGAEHPHTLNCIANLATTYMEQSRWEEAEELLVQAIETRKTVLGAEHPDTLSSIANLASTYWNQGRWKEAEELEVQVIEIQKTVLGAEHPDTLISMNNLAFTWNAQGKSVEAVNLMIECIQARTQILGADHPDTVSSSETLINWID